MLNISHASVCVPGEHNVNAHILVDTSVELPDPLERNAVEFCENGQSFRNETVNDYDHSTCRFSVCKSLICTDNQSPGALVQNLLHLRQHLDIQDPF